MSGHQIKVQGHDDDDDDHVLSFLNLHRQEKEKQTHTRCLTLGVLKHNEKRDHGFEIPLADLKQVIKEREKLPPKEYFE